MVVTGVVLGLSVGCDGLKVLSVVLCGCSGNWLKVVNIEGGGLCGSSELIADVGVRSM